MPYTGMILLLKRHSMKFFLDFLPGLAFLVALFIPENRQEGIYLATKVLIATSFLQIFLGWLLTRKIEKQYVVIFLVVLVLGSGHPVAEG